MIDIPPTSGGEGAGLAGWLVREILTAKIDPSADNGELRVLDAWELDPTHVAVTYTRAEVEVTLGLRIEVDPARPPEQELARILWDNLSEPLGSFQETLRPDGQGIYWWTGEPTRWHYQD